MQAISLNNSQDFSERPWSKFQIPKRVQRTIIIVWTNGDVVRNVYGCEFTELTRTWQPKMKAFIGAEVTRTWKMITMRKNIIVGKMARNMYKNYHPPKLPRHNKHPNIQENTGIPKPSWQWLHNSPVRFNPPHMKSFRWETFCGSCTYNSW